MITITVRQPNYGVVTECGGGSECDGSLETMNLQLVGLGKARLGKPLANVLALVALQLQHFAVLGVLDHCSIACKLLQK